MQIYEEKASIDPTTQIIEIISSKEVVSQDLKSLKLPETPRK